MVFIQVSWSERAANLGKPCESRPQRFVFVKGLAKRLFTMNEGSDMSYFAIFMKSENGPGFHYRASLAYLQ